MGEYIDSSCLRHTWSHTSLTLGAISLDGLDEQLDSQTWCYISAGEEHHSFHTSFKLTDQHMDTFAYQVLEDGQFFTGVAVPARWKQMSISNQLQWLPVNETQHVKSIVLSYHIMNVTFVKGWGFGVWGCLVVVWIMFRCYFAFCDATQLMLMSQMWNVATLMLCKDVVQVEYLLAQVPKFDFKVVERHMDDVAP